MIIETTNKKDSYKTTNTIVYDCKYHIIWCTKYRRKVLDTSIQDELKKAILALQSDLNFSVIEMEVMEDHIHLLLSASPAVAIDKLVGKIKGFTSHLLRDKYPQLKKRLPTLWTRSKFIATCGAVSLSVVQKYIEEQKTR